MLLLGGKKKKKGILMSSRLAVFLVCFLRMAVWKLAAFWSTWWGAGVLWESQPAAFLGSARQTGFIWHNASSPCSPETLHPGSIGLTNQQPWQERLQSPLKNWSSVTLGVLQWQPSTLEGGLAEESSCSSLLLLGHMEVMPGSASGEKSFGSHGLRRMF